MSGRHQRTPGDTELLSKTWFSPWPGLDLDGEHTGVGSALAGRTHSQTLGQEPRSPRRGRTRLCLGTPPKTRPLRQGGSTRRHANTHTCTHMYTCVITHVHTYSHTCSHSHARTHFPRVFHILTDLGPLSLLSGSARPTQSGEVDRQPHTERGDNTTRCWQRH